MDVRNLSFEKFRDLRNMNLSIQPRKHTVADGNPDCHYHDFYELVIVRSGRALHYMNSESLPIGSGNILLVPPDTVHGFFNPDELFIYNLLFCRDVFDFIREDLSPMPEFQMLFQVQPRLKSEQRAKAGLLSLSKDALISAVNSAEHIKAEIREQKAGTGVLVYGLFLSLLVHCLRNASLPQGTESGNYVGSISKLLAMLDQHPEKDWNIASMAKYAGMSAANFRLHFSRITDHPPCEYLLMLRLKKAAEILRSESASVSETAYRTGFHDSNYFTRQFHKFFGKSPRKYRR